VNITVKAEMNARKFPGPWRVEASKGAFAVQDANGFAYLPVQAAYLHLK